MIFLAGVGTHYIYRGVGDVFVWILDFGLCGMKEIKKSGGGDVRAKALSRDGEWDKA